MSAQAAAIAGAVGPVGKTYDKALPYLENAASVLFSGMGKSGIIAQKAAATLRSLGIPSHYVHPADASHGDMGAVHKDAALVLLSHSGETPELADLVFFARDMGIALIAVTSDPGSTLAQRATEAICYGEVTEVCPNGLAPTTSTTLALAVVDALAVDLAIKRGVTPADFRRYHPGGKLGSRLRTAKDVMITDLPLVNSSSPMHEVMLAMTGSVPGIAVVKGDHGITGVITDGDIRRAGESLLEQTVSSLMTTDPFTVPENARLDRVLEIMTRERVTKLLVEDAMGSISGVVTLHDAMRL